VEVYVLALLRRTPLTRLSPAWLPVMQLPADDRMNQVFHFIDTKFNPFQYQYRSIHNTRILSGEVEGVFAWIAVNYLTGALASNGKNHVETMEGRGVTY